jgi:hypothetical protein
VEVFCSVREMLKKKKKTNSLLILKYGAIFPKSHISGFSADLEHVAAQGS